jgi:ribosomal protein S18 acetylase RimI-like enzyme
VGDHPRDGGALTVRGGGRADAAYVVALGAIAFAPFGDYAPVMREFLASPEVVSFIAETSGEPVGFALLDRVPGSDGLADLVAIAVDARHRRAGIGRALLTRVIAACAEEPKASLLVLTVADGNDGAIALFRSMGFRMIPGSPGRYAGGQPSRRMGRSV